MAGLSAGQTPVDVVKAAQALMASRPSAAPQSPPEPAQDETAACPFGHANDAQAAFCASCGMKMGAVVGKPDLAAARPVPAEQLDEAARAERDRRHAEALAAARRFETAPEQIEQTAGPSVLIHFTEDGLTAFGRVWYRGQELEIGPDHPRWPDAVGWISLDRIGQFERWGRQYFEHGPWPGRRSYAAPEAEFEQLRAVGGEGTFAGPSPEQLAQADQAEARRGRGVPAASYR